MDGVQLPQGYSHFQEAVYFLPLSSQKFLVLILSTSEGWKAESTLEPTQWFWTRDSWIGNTLTTRPLLHKLRGTKSTQWDIWIKIDVSGILCL